jgi:hypothetical protein
VELLVDRADLILELAQGFRGEPSRVLIQHLELSPTRSYRAVEHTDQRALPGPAGPGQSHLFASSDLQVDLRQGREIPELLTDVGELKDHHSATQSVILPI